jgi:hypothetical protein
MRGKSPCGCEKKAGQNLPDDCQAFCGKRADGILIHQKNSWLRLPHQKFICLDI